MAKVKRPIKYITPSSAWIESPDGPAVELHVATRIESEANRREHWRAVNNRKQRQKAAWLASLQDAPVVTWKPPHLVTLTRLGPKILDDDNVAGGFKKVRDCVAYALDVDDGDTSKVRWKYEQQKSKAYGAIVRIEPASPQK